MANRFRLLIRILQRLLEPMTAELISDEVLARFRRSAECLRNDPLYAPYAREYLHS